MNREKAGLAVCAAALCTAVVLASPVLIRKKGSVELKADILLKEQAGEAFFSNDLGVTDIGDPFVLMTEKDGYYMYCTSAPNGFYCWRSDDLAHWSDKKLCYVRKPDSWCVDCFWAPEVVFHEGRYYMFYTAKNRAGSLRIGLAVSDAPDGPFEDVKNEPFFDFGYAAIDANVLVDDDGKNYLYYSRDCSENEENGIKLSEIYGVALSGDLLSVQGEAVKLLTPEQSWEKASGDTRWNEGPEMITHGGRYYLTYSANFFASPSYSLGYAVSDSPLGPFVKADENPILTSGIRKDVSGTGHHSFTLSPDKTQLWAVYHSHTDLENPGGNRKVNIDRAGFDEGGRLHINGPMTALQPVPSGGACTDVTGSFNASVNKAAAPLLTDGLFSIYKKQKDRDMELTADEGKVTVALEAGGEQTISAIAVYPGQGSLEKIQSVRFCVDQDKWSEELAVGENSASPIILSFDPVKCGRLELYITLRESADAIKLSEITLLRNKEG